MIFEPDYSNRTVACLALKKKFVKTRQNSTIRFCIEFPFYAYNFKKDNAKNIIKDRKLAWCGFTHDYAISYCIIKGYSRIILAGAADFIEGKHYSTDEEFRYSEKLKNMSKRFIEEICSQRASIFTLNPDSFLNIPRITISELLT